MSATEMASTLEMRALPNTVTRMASPGKVASHQAVEM